MAPKIKFKLWMVSLVDCNLKYLYVITGNFCSVSIKFQYIAICNTKRISTVCPTGNIEMLKHIQLRQIFWQNFCSWYPQHVNATIVSDIFQLCQLFNWNCLCLTVRNSVISVVFTFCQICQIFDRPTDRRTDTVKHRSDLPSLKKRNCCVAVIRETKTKIIWI